MDFPCFSTLQRPPPPSTTHASPDPDCPRATKNSSSLHSSSSNEATTHCRRTGRPPEPQSVQSRGSASATNAWLPDLEERPRSSTVTVSASLPRGAMSRNRSTVSGGRRGGGEGRGKEYIKPSGGAWTREAYIYESRLTQVDGLTRVV